MNQEFDPTAFEAAKSDIYERYANQDDPKLREHIWDATRRNLIEGVSRSEAKKFDAVQQMAANKGHAMDGVEFLTNRPKLKPLWGSGDEILAVRGQGTIIVGPEGVGKSTVAQQLLCARMELRSSRLFGYPVAADDERPILYMAMDRPDQIQDSLIRMIDVSDPDVAMRVKRQLIVWREPLPFKADADPERFATWIADIGHDPGLVFFDSIKDMLSSITADAAGLGFNEAIQRILANGTDTIANHHLRKANADNPKPDKLDDVYGSKWITAGQGSVILLWGDTGALSVELSQLKPIRMKVGPLAVKYDHSTGSAEGGDAATILTALAVQCGDDGFNLDDAVLRLRGTLRTAAEWGKDSKAVRRFLTKLVASNVLIEKAGKAGGSKGGVQAMWRLKKASDTGGSAPLDISFTVVD